MGYIFNEYIIRGLPSFFFSTICVIVTANVSFKYYWEDERVSSKSMFLFLNNPPLPLRFVLLFVTKEYIYRDITDQHNPLFGNSSHRTLFWTKFGMLIASFTFISPLLADLLNGAVAHQTEIIIPYLIYFTLYIGGAIYAWRFGRRLIKIEAVIRKHNETKS